MTKEIMPRRTTTRKLAGGALRRYFDALLDAEHELTVAPRRRLSDTLARELAQVRVRTPVPSRRRVLADGATAITPGATAQASTPAATVSPAPEPPVAPPTPPAPAFNPHAFSAVALMTRGGREALLARLETITDPANLKKLAIAQHVGLPPEAITAADLRQAILLGVANRIADRRAAAS